MKKELRNAREQIQENLLTFLENVLSEEDKTRACDLIVQGFAPLFEEAESKTRKSVFVTQIGESGFRVERTTNFLEQKCGVSVSRDDLKKFLTDGIFVTVARNK